MRSRGEDEGLIGGTQVTLLSFSGRWLQIVGTWGLMQGAYTSGGEAGSSFA